MSVPDGPGSRRDNPKLDISLSIAGGFGSSARPALPPDTQGSAKHAVAVRGVTPLSLSAACRLPLIADRLTRGAQTRCVLGRSPGGYRPGPGPFTARPASYRLTPTERAACDEPTSHPSLQTITPRSHARLAGDEPALVHGKSRRTAPTRLEDVRPRRALRLSADGQPWACAEHSRLLAARRLHRAIRHAGRSRQLDLQG